MSLEPHIFDLRTYQNKLSLTINLYKSKKFEDEFEQQMEHLYQNNFGILVPKVQELLNIFNVKVKESEILQAIKEVLTNDFPDMSTIMGERHEIFRIPSFGPDVENAYGEIYDLQLTLGEQVVSSVFLFTDDLSYWWSSEKEYHVWFLREIISTPIFRTLSNILRKNNIYVPSIIDTYINYIEKTLVAQLGINILASDPMGAMAYVLEKRHNFIVDVQNKLKLPEGDMYPFYVNVHPTHYKFLQ